MAISNPQQERLQREATETTSADIQGKIVEVALNLRNNGFSRSTIRSYPMYLRLLVRHGADLMNPESVKEAIARQEGWNASTKLIAVHSYGYFAKLNGIHWTLPRYRMDRKLPFIPLESEIDSLIASTNRRMAAFLQLLKETGARCGEACEITWMDLDTEHNTITINAPEKGGDPRNLKISSKLVAMLNMLPRVDKRIFRWKEHRYAANSFCWTRNRAANKLQNPRLLRIHLHTFRHWRATMEYHRTKDLLHVMKLLGHRNPRSTMVYTQLVEFEGDEYHSAVAETIAEAQKLIEAGHEYVCIYEGKMLFRKRK